MPSIWYNTFEFWIYITAYVVVIAFTTQICYNLAQNFISCCRGTYNHIYKKLTWDKDQYRLHSWNDIKETEI